MAYQAAKDNCHAYWQHHGSRQKSLKAEVLQTNAYDADLQTTSWASAQNTHNEVIHRSMTWHYLQPGPDNTTPTDRSLLTICTSAKCKSVRKQHTILQDTPGDLTIVSKYF